MSLLGYLLAFTGVLYCTAGPVSDPAALPDSRGQEHTLDVLGVTSEPKESTCLPASAPPNAQVINQKEEYFSGDVMEIACEPGYLLDGSEKVLCEDGKWKSPPLCIKKLPCSSPPTISNAEISKETLTDQYYTGSAVEYICKDGYHIVGSNKIKCVDRIWLTPPTCVENPCGKPPQMENGKPKDGWKEYKHAESAPYECSHDYTLSESTAAVCLYGKWNRIPKCILRICPPVQVNSNVNLLTTSYDKNYSVGQVIKFECKNEKQKLNGASEIFCTSEGEWNALPPTCKDISCRKPKIAHGKVINPKSRYNDQETANYSCNPGYKADISAALRCTKTGWSPMPSCSEIVCFQETVKNGAGRFLKETYKEGETVELVCNEGYTIEHSPEEPRKCILHGWNPPLKCIRQCSRPSPDLINAQITHTSRNYIEGDQISFQCYRDYSTSDGKKNGVLTCLPDGRFSGEKCYKTCKKPELANGVYMTENIIEIGNHITYKCNEGFISSNKKYEDRSQCSNEGWYPKPECKGITCELSFDKGNFSFNYGTIVRFECSRNLKLEGANSIQCFYYGWGPDIPVCKGLRGQEYAPSILEVTSEPKESSCPPAFAPPNAQVINLKEEYLSGDAMEIACEPGFLLDGSNKVLCKDGKWMSSPLCIRKLSCISPPTISNGEINIVTLKYKYYTGNTVGYICKGGYHIDGAKEIKCVDKIWPPPPTCVENPCGKPPQIENGKPKDGQREYKHAESAPYECFCDYTLSGSTTAVCLFGKWDRIPKCIYSSCKEPPKIQNGETKGLKKKVYTSGEMVTYECLPGFTMGQNAESITCKNSAWTEPPECRTSSR